MNILPGQKVICINAYNSTLNVNQIYTIKSIDDGICYLNETFGLWALDRFDLIEEQAGKQNKVVIPKVIN